MISFNICLLFLIKLYFPVTAERVESAVQSLRQEFGEQHVWVPPLGLLYFILFFSF